MISVSYPSPSSSHAIIEPVLVEIPLADEREDLVLRPLSPDDVARPPVHRHHAAHARGGPGEVHVADVRRNVVTVNACKNKSDGFMSLFLFKLRMCESIA